MTVKFEEQEHMAKFMNLVIKGEGPFLGLTEIIELNLLFKAILITNGPTTPKIEDVEKTLKKHRAPYKWVSQF